MISCLVTYEMHWQSMCQPLLQRLNEVEAIPNTHATEGKDVVGRRQPSECMSQPSSCPAKTTDFIIIIKI